MDRRLRRITLLSKKTQRKKHTHTKTNKSMTTPSESDTDTTSNSSDQADDAKKLESTTTQELEFFKVVDKGKQSSGRWSRTEHEAFLKGMERYGRAWRKVASTVGTRTVMQTRTHAQKHFEKEQGVVKILSRAKIAAKGSTPLKKRKIKVLVKERKPTKSKHEQDESSKREQDETTREEQRQDTKPPKVKSEGVIVTTSSVSAAMSPGYTAVSIQDLPFRTPPTLPLDTLTPATVASVTFAGWSSYPNIMDHNSSLSLRDKDILLPIYAATAARPANIEYMELLKINCVLFHALPHPDQLWLCRNLVHFLTAVRGRRWISCCHTAARAGATHLTLIRNPIKMVEDEFRMDAVKQASLQSRPFWLLGEFDPEQAHKGSPFVYRDMFGNWKKLKLDEIRIVLLNEGPKNLLLLPASVQVLVDSGHGISGSGGSREPMPKSLRVQERG